MSADSESKDQDPNVVDQLTSLLDESARLSAGAWKSAMAATERVTQLWQQTASGHSQPPKVAMDNLTRTASDISDLLLQFFKQAGSGVPEASGKKFIEQLEARMNLAAQSDMEKDFERLARAGKQMSENVSQVDSERISGLFQSMLDEYVVDLGRLKDDSFRVDTAELVEAWCSVMAGSSDPKSKRIVDRFLQAMAAKSALGGEYYIQPEKVDVGQTPRERIGTVGPHELYRYVRPEGVALSDKPPLLIIYSLINRTYLEDLLPGQSMVEHLLAQGLDVYMIEWTPSEPGDRSTTLDSYIDPAISQSVDMIFASTGASSISLLGHCMGGNLALIYAALNPEKTDRLVCLSTPVVGSKEGVVGLWCNPELFPIDAIVETFGHVPGKFLRYSLMSLKPYNEVLKWKMFIENLGNDRVMESFYAVDRWANDNVDVPGETFRKFIVEVLHTDTFASGKMEIHGRPVRLEDVTCPLLNIASDRDWLVPPKTSRVLNGLVGSSEQEFILMPGAHLGIILSPHRFDTWSRITEFYTRAR